VFPLEVLFVILVFSVGIIIFLLDGFWCFPLELLSFLFSRWIDSSVSRWNQCFLNGVWCSALEVLLFDVIIVFSVGSICLFCSNRFWCCPSEVFFVWTDSGASRCNYSFFQSILVFSVGMIVVLNGFSCVPLEWLFREWILVFSVGVLVGFLKWFLCFPSGLLCIELVLVSFVGILVFVVLHWFFCFPLELFFFCVLLNGLLCRVADSIVFFPSTGFLCFPFEVLFREWILVLPLEFLLFRCLCVPLDVLLFDLTFAFSVWVIVCFFIWFEPGGFRWSYFFFLNWFWCLPLELLCFWIDVDAARLNSCVFWMESDVFRWNYYVFELRLVVSACALAFFNGLACCSSDLFVLSGVLCVSVVLSVFESSIVFSTGIVGFLNWLWCFPLEVVLSFLSWLLRFLVEFVLFELIIVLSVGLVVWIDYYVFCWNYCLFWNEYGVVLWNCSFLEVILVVSVGSIVFFVFEQILVFSVGINAFLIQHCVFSWSSYVLTWLLCVPPELLLFELTLVFSIGIIVFLIGSCVFRWNCCLLNWFLCFPSEILPCSVFSFFLNGVLCCSLQLLAFEWYLCFPFVLLFSLSNNWLWCSPLVFCFFLNWYGVVRCFFLFVEWIIVFSVGSSVCSKWLLCFPSELFVFWVDYGALHWKSCFWFNWLLCVPLEFLFCELIIVPSVGILVFWLGFGCFRCSYCFFCVWLDSCVLRLKFCFVFFLFELIFVLPVWIIICLTLLLCFPLKLCVWVDYCAFRWTYFFWMDYCVFRWNYCFLFELILEFFSFPL